MKMCLPDMCSTVYTVALCGYGVPCMNETRCTQRMYVCWASQVNCVWKYVCEVVGWEKRWEVRVRMGA